LSAWLAKNVPSQERSQAGWVESWRLIAGLGNPGRKYALTRHNAGFMVAQRLAERAHVSWSNERKFSARLARWEHGGQKVLLVMPETFMNASGEAVGAIAGFYQVLPRQVLVVVDDADLPFGEIRMRPSGSSGGHHGLESVEQHLATRDYPRLRIGIGREPGSAREITGYVLAEFGRGDRELLDKVLDRACHQVECWLSDGVQAAMNRFNGKVPV
jgi:PTH1 family peptidyl-tRNA hydrolase